MKEQKFEHCQIIEKNDFLELSFNNDSTSKNTLSSVIFIEFNVEKEDVITKKHKILTLEAMKGTLELKSPVDGKIVDINTEIEDDPEILKENVSTWLVRFEK